MRKEILVTLVGLVAIMPAYRAIGQIDPGIRDTVRLGCPAVMSPIVEGDSIAVPIYVFADETIGGWSFPFTWTGDNIIFSSWNVNAPSVVPEDGTPLANITRLHENRVMVGWITFYPLNPVPADASGARLFGTMYFRVTPGAVQSYSDIDTMTIGIISGWSFELVSAIPTYTVIKPEYVDCGAEDIHLTFVCGDLDGNGIVTITDAVRLIDYIFTGGPAPVPVEAGDVDCSGEISIADPIYLISYFFGGGAVPCAACK